MAVLQTVFNSREFYLNDNVLMEFHNYFEEESKNYNYFALDNEDMPALRSFVEQIKYIDTDSTILVGTYGYEITSNKGEKSTYADTLWIDTVLSVSKIEELIKESGVAEQSDISFLKECDDMGNGKVWLVTQTEQSARIIELTDHKKLDAMIVLYWD